MGEFVEIETLPEKRIATLRLNRPPMNAISAGVVRDLGEAAELLSNNEDIAAVVIWGGPKIFAAGADIKEMPNRDPGEVPRSITEAFTGIAELTQITISAVNGYALGGGCELALCTDFRIAGDDAVFGQPEVLLGIIPGAGGTQRLPRIIGITKAKELMYTGRRVPAAEALEIGLADEGLPSSRSISQGIRASRNLCQRPSLASQHQKGHRSRLRPADARSFGYRNHRVQRLLQNSRRQNRHPKLHRKRPWQSHLHRQIKPSSREGTKAARNNQRSASSRLTVFLASSSCSPEMSSS